MIKHEVQDFEYRLALEGVGSWQALMSSATLWPRQRLRRARAAQRIANMLLMSNDGYPIESCILHTMLTLVKHRFYIASKRECWYFFVTPRSSKQPMEWNALSTRRVMICRL